MLGKTIARLYSKLTERREFYLYSDFNLSCNLSNRFRFLTNLGSWMQMMIKCIPLEGFNNLPNALINLRSMTVMKAVTCRLLDLSHILSRDIPLDFLQDLFTLLLPGQVNLMPLLVKFYG